MNQNEDIKSAQETLDRHDEFSEAPSQLRELASRKSVLQKKAKYYTGAGIAEYPRLELRYFKYTERKKVWLIRLKLEANKVQNKAFLTTEGGVEDLFGAIIEKTDFVPM